MKNKKEVFRLFSCCIPVNGAKRSLICDVQREFAHFIPNILYEILTNHKDKTLNQIKKHYQNAHNKCIEEYFAFLLESELGFWTNEPESFPEMDLTWESPSTITNAIIEVGKESNLNWGNIFGQLNHSGCQALEIRVFNECLLDEIDLILQPSHSTGLRSINLILKYSSMYYEQDFQKLVRKNPRVKSIIVTGAPENTEVIGNGYQILYFKEKISSSTCCGNVDRFYFTYNLSFFTESQFYNTCLNRKISINESGEIKNCPSMPESFGNINQVSLAEVVKLKEFRKLWNINKDHIDVCRDCEFRHICTDCRVFIKDKNNIHSKPSLCNYNPYTATWEKF